MMPEAISNGIALFLAWLFAVAALHKLRSPEYFLRLVTAYLPGHTSSRVLVLLIGVVELSIAILLFIPSMQGLGFTGASTLLAGYAAMMGWQYSRGRADLECGCAGPASTLTVGPPLIIRNLVCVGLAILAQASAGHMPGSLAAASLALVLAFFLITLYLCSDQMIANAQAMAGDI